MAINLNSTNNDNKRVYLPAAAAVVATGVASGVVGFNKTKPSIDILKDVFVKNIEGANFLNDGEKFTKENIPKFIEKTKTILSEKAEIALSCMETLFKSKKALLSQEKTSAETCPLLIENMETDLNKCKTFIKDMQAVIKAEKLKTAGIYGVVGAAVAAAVIGGYLYATNPDKNKQA